jgi:hypothetical protein
MGAIGHSMLGVSAMENPSNPPGARTGLSGYLGCSDSSLDTPVVLVVDAVDEGEEMSSVMSVLLRMALSSVSRSSSLVDPTWPSTGP